MPFKKGHRYNRWATRGANTSARAAAAAKSRLKSSSPEPDNDEDMPDAEEEEEEAEVEDVEDTHATPKSLRSTSRITPQNTPRSNRRRRQATQPNYKIPDPHVPVEDDDQASVDSPPSTTAPSGRGRGRGRGGFRGTPRHAMRRGRAGRALPGSALSARVPLDDDGNPHEVENDELVLPTDPEGEKKIDIDGYLQGGREYRVRVFAVKGRGRRLYMLSTEPARTLGYRDSYLFFTKHPLLYKLILTDPEKMDLIERDYIPHSYKGRTIGVVTAHSVYREFGARIVDGGRKVTDDYYETEARARGDVEGELADAGNLSGPGAATNGVIPMGRPGGPGRRKAQVTTANWMLEHAREASRFNAALTAKRKLQNREGVYDPHTNMVMWPSIMQPTVARWEAIDPADDMAAASELKKLPNGISATNGEASHHHEQTESSKAFSPPSKSVTSNFLVIDTLLQHPPSAAFPNAGPGNSINASATFGPGLGNEVWRFPDMSRADIQNLELDEESRRGLRQVQNEQREWTDAWKGETLDGARGNLRVSVKGL